MNKIKKSTNHNSSNLNNQNQFGVWETIDLLTKHQTNNNNTERDVYDNIENWLYKVTNKLNQLNKFPQKESSAYDKDTIFTYSSPDELTPVTIGMDSGTCNSTPRKTKDKMSLMQDKTKSKKMNRPEQNSLLDMELMLPLNELMTTTGIGGPDAPNKKKKKHVKLPKIKRSKKFKDVPFEDEELYKTNYFGSLVECNFNLPRVSAQLEKLMGTNIVRLTDRNYMQQLRTRIQEEYHATLQKRINQREESEDERQKELILNGNYSVHNCPPRLIIVHSVALAREMERERNLIMSGKGETCPHDLADHPVFIINQETNEQIAKARSKLKTTREKNAERLIRQGAKWEKEREIYDEMDRLKEIQRKEKREAELLMEQEYANANRVRGIDLLRVKNRDYAENEMALKTFMDAEREKMLCRTGAEAKRLKLKHQEARDKMHKKAMHHEDFDGEGDEEGEGEYEDLEGEFLENDEDEPETAKDGIVQLHPPAQHSGEGKPDMDATSTNAAFETAPDSMSTSQFAHEYDVESYAPSITTVEIDEMLTNEEQAEVTKQHMCQDEDYMKYHYEDPKIIQLKQTDNVADLYDLADEIIGGLAANQPKKTDKPDHD